MYSLKHKLKRFILKILNLPEPLSLNSGSSVLNKSLNREKIELIIPDSIFCTINFDDQCPVNKQIKNRDYGGNIVNGIINQLISFLERNPNVAITSFVIPNFQGNINNNRFLLTNPEYHSWIDFYNHLSEKFNLEFAIHGYFHLQKENIFFQSHTEFAFKTSDEILQSITKSINVFKSIGWTPYGFRQPGWDLSIHADIFKIAKQVGLKYIASNSLDGGLNSGSIERVSNYYPTLIDGVINFPQNIELDWTLEKIYFEIDKLAAMKALISIKGHFVDKDICNCLNDSNFEKLQAICNYINNRYAGLIKFRTFNQLVEILSKK